MLIEIIASCNYILAVAAIIGAGPDNNIFPLARAAQVLLLIKETEEYFAANEKMRERLTLNLGIFPPFYLINYGKFLWANKVNSRKRDKILKETKTVFDIVFGKRSQEVFRHAQFTSVYELSVTLVLHNFLAKHFLIHSLKCVHGTPVIVANESKWDKKEAIGNDQWYILL